MLLVLVVWNLRILNIKLNSNGSLRILMFVLGYVSFRNNLCFYQIFESFSYEKLISILN